MGDILFFPYIYESKWLDGYQEFLEGSQGAFLAAFMQVGIQPKSEETKDINELFDSFIWIVGCIGTDHYYNKKVFQRDWYKGIMEFIENILGDLPVRKQKILAKALFQIAKDYPIF